jgi:hypothetical protein
MLFVPSTTTTSTSTSTSTSVTSTTSTSSTSLPASWAVFHATVIEPSCGSCHGTGAAAGGLGGLEACVTGHAALVDVASVELPGMDLVQPGDPSTSWLTYKLADTQNQFDAQCVDGSCGGRMPPNQQRLSAAARDAIARWILAGAANDCPGDG